MRGKKQIAAVVLAVILAVAAGLPHSMVYAEPDITGNAQAADASSDDTQKEEKKEEEEIHVEIPIAEDIGTSLGDLFKGLKLD